MPWTLLINAFTVVEMRRFTAVTAGGAAYAGFSSMCEIWANDPSM